MSSPDKDMCAKTPTPESSTESVKNETLSMDQSCNNTDAAAAGAGEPRSDAQSVSGTPRSNSGNVFDSSRNPITGLGLNGDGVGGWKPKTPKQREGNPVTGEGYTGPVSVPGVTPVVNKNRVPPGGYSSGLW